MGFKVLYRSERKGLTVEMDSNGGPPHNDRQRHNNLISVPNRNASGIDEHLISENCLYMEPWPNTYVRRTINSEAAIDARLKNS
jgi:hypothetical protein